MPSRITMRQQLRTRSYRKDESLIGSLRGDRFALANLRSIAPCRHPTITHCRLRSVSVDAAGASTKRTPPKYLTHEANEVHERMHDVISGLLAASNQEKDSDANRPGHRATRPRQPTRIRVTVNR